VDIREYLIAETVNGLNNMLDKYLKYKEFNDWVLHNKLMTKLINTPIFCTLILEDNRRYEILFFDGEVFSYKFFIFSLEIYNISRFYYRNSQIKNKSKLEEHDKIVQCLIRKNIIKEVITPHPYHKNSKPKIITDIGNSYHDFITTLTNLDFSNVYELLPIIERAKNE